MLQVQKAKNGVWVTNGDYRVFVDEDGLYNNVRLNVVTDNSTSDEVVYTFVKPIEVGETCNANDVVPRHNMILLKNSSKSAYQFRSAHVYNGTPYERVWVCTGTREMFAKPPAGEFTVLYLGDEYDD